MHLALVVEHVLHPLSDPTVEWSYESLCCNRGVIFTESIGSRDS